MGEIKDGGPAFPTDTITQWMTTESGAAKPVLKRSGGLTLRDWFASQALAGMLAQSHAGPKDWQVMGHGWGEDCMNSLNKHETHIARTLAGFAYQMADALLRAREGGSNAE